MIKYNHNILGKNIKEFFISSSIKNSEIFRVLKESCYSVIATYAMNSNNAIIYDENRLFNPIKIIVNDNIITVEEL